MLLTERLRAETRNAHEQIESAIHLFDAPDLGVRYIDLLSRWAGFHEYWERAGAAWFAADHFDFFNVRCKLRLLMDDLRDLGSIGRFERFDESSLPLKSLSDALGTLYVVEGSTLGGQLISREISKRLKLLPDHGLRFFSSYGEQIGARWKDTKAFLNAAPFTESANAIVESANRTFNALSIHLAAVPELSSPRAAH